VISGAFGAIFRGRFIAEKPSPERRIAPPERRHPTRIRPVHLP